MLEKLSLDCTREPNGRITGHLRVHAGPRTAIKVVAIEIIEPVGAEVARQAYPAEGGPHSYHKIPTPFQARRHRFDVAIGRGREGSVLFFVRCPRATGTLRVRVTLQRGCWKWRRRVAARHPVFVGEEPLVKVAAGDFRKFFQSLASIGGLSSKKP